MTADSDLVKRRNCVGASPDAYSTEMKVDDRGSHRKRRFGQAGSLLQAGLLTSSAGVVAMSIPFLPPEVRAALQT